jgi:tetratricopeptide (TPR) repeat protein
MIVRPKKGTDVERPGVKKLLQQANAAQQMGDIMHAEALLRQATDTSKRSPEAWLLLGEFLTKSKRYAEALDCYDKLFSIKPHPDALYNYAVCFYHTGQLDKAIPLLKRVFNAPHPYYRSLAWNTYGNIFCLQNPTSKWADLTQHTPEGPVDTWSLGTGILKLALGAYCSGDKISFEKNLSRLQQLRPELAEIQTHGLSESALGTLVHNQRHLLSFVLYLEQMARHAAWEKPAPTQPTLHVLGDSHSLTLARHSVDLGNSQPICQSHLTIGCKAFHLNTRTKTPFREGFLNKLNQLPETATVLTLFGEIDCRPSEGMLPHAISKKRPLEDIVEQTAASYVTFLHENRGEHSLIVGGVPAPCEEAVQEVSPSLQPTFIRMVRLFNLRLKHHCKKTGLHFIDIHTRTAGPGGVAAPGFHMDIRHLLPTTWQQAFKENFISADGERNPPYP